MSLMAYIEEYY